jgi:transposase-like protein
MEILARAEFLGNIRQAAEEYGIGERLIYKWKQKIILH